jgi:hypothetical protein
MQYEPSRFLSDLQILGELGAGNPFPVRGDHPNRSEPFAKRKLSIFEDRANLDAEPLTAVAAFVGAPVGEIIDFGRATVRTESTSRPTDRAQIVDAGLLIREGLKEIA